VKVVWSLVASIASVAIGLTTSAATLFLYRYAWEQRTVSRLPSGGYLHSHLSGWERTLFEVLFYCLALGAVAGTIALSAWLARRWGGSVGGTVACTLFLIGVVALPLLGLASVWNCGVVDGFPLSANCE